MKRAFWVITLLTSLIMVISAQTSSVEWTENTYAWAEYNLLPSKANEGNFGDIIMISAPEYKGKRAYVVKYLFKSEDDIEYYKDILRQDFGWWKNQDGTWNGNGNSKRTKVGTLYLNPSLKVAVYFFPDGSYWTYSVYFK